MMRKRGDKWFWHHIAPTPAFCWEWVGWKNHDGYGKLTRHGKDVSAHRVAWEFSNGEIPAGLHVLHRCDNPPCVNPEHLFLGTNLENVIDKMAKGRTYRPAGELHGMAKLSSADVAEIIRTYRRGQAIEFGVRYGVHETTIQRIIAGRTWSAC